MSSISATVSDTNPRQQAGGGNNRRHINAKILNNIRNASGSNKGRVKSDIREVVESAVTIIEAHLHGAYFVMDETNNIIFSGQNGLNAGRP